MEKLPNKAKTRIQTYRAIKKGLLVKKDCEHCTPEEAKKRKSYAHHLDYTDPLKILWLCGFHHSKWHNENGYPPGYSKPTLKPGSRPRADQKRRLEIAKLLDTEVDGRKMTHWAISQKLGIQQSLVSYYAKTRNLGLPDKTLNK